MMGDGAYQVYDVSEVLEDSQDFEAAEPVESGAPSEESGESAVEPAASQEVVLAQEQFDAFSASIRASVTVGFLTLVLLSFLLGSVLYSHFVRGWRS